MQFKTYKLLDTSILLRVRKHIGIGFSKLKLNFLN